MNDLIGYLKRMEKAMVEKLYFLNEINLTEFDFVIDFGCANGAMLKAISSLSKNTTFIGVDCNQNSLEIAKHGLTQSNIVFVDNLQAAFDIIKDNKNVAIILSSVLHEISKKSIKKIIKASSKINTIIIRDMFFDEKFNKKVKNSAEILSKCEKVQNYQIESFVNKHGKIKNTKNLYHFFLKYTYTNNWQSEVNENYFSIPWKRLNKSFKRKGFTTLYNHEYTLSFKQQEILQNFSYHLNAPTHKNIIYKKVK